MDKNLLYNLKGITPEEFQNVQHITQGMNEQQEQQFMMFYSGKRQSPSDLLLFTLLGFVVVAGVQRFVIGQIGMGILYFFTFGLCFVGTILDAINHKNLANEHNQKVALECVQLVRMGL
jgi:TM2 domain-containing membrane protein YozV